jgi:hypothetical protein
VGQGEEIEKWRLQTSSTGTGGGLLEAALTRNRGNRGWYIACGDERAYICGRSDSVRCGLKTTADIQGH